MICPKCTHQQIDTILCESCGIYFEKYKQVQEYKKQPLNIKTTPESSSSSYKKIMVTLLLASPIAYALWENKTSSDSQFVTELAQESESEFFLKEEAANGIANQLLKSHLPRNPIESARNATVFIETSWGTLGSGFIISKDCQVITNRHVIEMDVEKEIQRKKSDPNFLRFIAEKNAQRRDEVYRLVYQYQEMVSMDGETPESEDLKEEIDRRRQEINSMPTDVEDYLQEQVEDLKEEGIHEGYDVSLIDGTSFKIYNIETSDHYDLALFKLNASDCPFIQLNTEKDLQQGTQLFTIGNPSGLTYTVTAGIFSGYRDMKGQKFIQTDASINPGNSGGPLVTEDGKLVGINTSILLGTQGIGFAIPAHIIKQEFGNVAQ